MEKSKTLYNKFNNKDVDVFMKQFDKKFLDINNKMSIIENIDTEKTKLLKINELQKEIEGLQNYLQENIKFLSDYKVKSMQILLNSLITQCDNLRSQILPKRKFGFSRKTNIAATNKETFKKFTSKFDLIQSTSGCTVSDLKNVHITLSSENVNEKDVFINNLCNCLVQITGVCETLQIHNITNSIILFGPIKRAAFIENCENTLISLTCRQLRIHSCTQCELNINVSTKAIMEDSNKIKISKYNYNYDQLDSDLADASLDPICKSIDIGDFNWLSSDIPSPNWTMNEENYDWKQIIADFELKYLRNNV